MIIKVTVETRNRPNEKLVLTFTNRKAAKEFHYSIIARADVVSSSVDDLAVTTFANVAKATDALDFWAK